MPEIPVYHSQGAPPETSRRPLANPGIVGGGEILQGMQRMEGSLLQLFHVQQQQAYYQQITDASKIHTSVVDQLNSKMQEFTTNQEALASSGQPIENPHLLSQRFNVFAKDLHKQAMDAASSLSPAGQKYLTTHLQTTINGAIAKYTDDTNKQWQAWNYAEVLTTRDKLEEQAVQDPTKMKDLVAFLATNQSIGMLDKAEVQASYNRTKKNIDYNAVMPLILGDPATFLKSNGDMAGYPAWKFDVAERRSHLEAAANALARQNTEKARLDTEYEKRLNAAQDDAYNLVVNKGILTDNKGVRVYSDKQILRELETDASMQQLGKHYHTAVEAFRLRVDNERYNVKTDSKSFDEILGNVYNGMYDNENQVIRAAHGKTDPGDMTKLVAAFHSWRTHGDAEAQRNFSQATQSLRYAMSVPPNSRIDGFPFEQAHGRAFNRLVLLWQRVHQQSIDEHNPDLLRKFPILVEAQRMANEEMKPLLGSIIQIVQQRVDGLRYKSEAELATAREKDEISQNEYESQLLTLQQLKELELLRQRQIEDAKPLKRFGE
jgi:hypothetical protein